MPCYFRLSRAINPDWVMRRNQTGTTGGIGLFQPLIYGDEYPRPKRFLTL